MGEQEQEEQKEPEWNLPRMLVSMFFATGIISSVSLCWAGGGWWAILGAVGGAFWVACLLELHHDD